MHLNRSRIIGFTGSMGAGKTLAAQYLATKCALNCVPQTTIKFAAPIYDCVNFICRRTHLEWDKNRMRPIMQFIGMHLRESCGENFWVSQWEKEYMDYAQSMRKPMTVFCDDLRFDNEAEMLKRLGAIIVRIEADEAACKARGLDTSTKGHASERGIKGQYVDKVITNNGSIEEFYEKLEALYQEACNH